MLNEPTNIMDDFAYLQLVFSNCRIQCLGQMYCKSIVGPMVVSDQLQLKQSLSNKRSINVF